MSGESPTQDGVFNGLMFVTFGLCFSRKTNFRLCYSTVVDILLSDLCVLLRIILTDFFSN